MNDSAGTARPASSRAVRSAWAVVATASVVVALVPLYYLFGGVYVPEQPELRLLDDYLVDERPDLLSYEELVILSDTPLPQLDEELRQRLDTLLTTPFVNNEAYYDGAQPHRPDEPGLGPILRVVSWNIEHGLRFDLIRSALAGGDAFLDHVDAGEDDLDVTDETRREIEREVQLLQTADVLVLQELDWGIKRTEYRAVVEELARATGMNWAYGVEFVEVDPFLLGTEEFLDSEEEDRAELRRRSAVDKQRYKGLHGTAMLSRYPIAEARLIPLEYQAYDWFAGELAGASGVETVKRNAAEEVFRTAMTREIRRGGRTLLLVDLAVDAIAEGRVTIAAAHFESRGEPSARQSQLQEVLGHLGDIRNPVVLAGDMPRDESGSYRFAPHWGRTMETINYSVTGRMSDHSPICRCRPATRSHDRASAGRAAPHAAAERRRCRICRPGIRAT